jgi:hypothetical protein
MRSVMLVRLLALVLIANGCSDPIGPDSIRGKWSQDFTVPGSAFEMDLNVMGSTISGAGDWCGEAGPCGIVAVTGTVNGASVHLDLSFTAQFPQIGPTTLSHFDGRLTSARSLRGSIVRDVPPGQPPPPAADMNFHRI